MILGRVLDGRGAPVADALIEIWQADGDGRYAGFHRPFKALRFNGFGRATCDDAGRFTIETVKPGSVVDLDEQSHAPHIAVGVFGKGINRRLYTRIYFDDERANERDPLLTSIAEERRSTLIARVSRTNPHSYEFTIRLQGHDETVFLDG